MFRRVSVLASLAMMALVASSCLVNQGALSANDKLPANAPTSMIPALNDVVYGPLAQHHLDVHRPTRAPVGVIVYFHSGGWCCGDENDVDALILSTIARGYVVVSVNYRLAPFSTAEQMMADGDLAVRWVRQHRSDWGAAGRKVIVAGGSAGGNLALMLAAAPARYKDRTLVPALNLVDSRVDGVISFVGPSDLRPYIDGAIPPSTLDGQELVENFLDCSNRGRVHPGTGTRMPTCSDLRVLAFSPLFWANAAAMFGGRMPPAYLGYGALDTLVPVWSQATPLHDAWAQTAGSGEVWLDVPPSAGHNLTHELNATAFYLWLRRFEP